MFCPKINNLCQYIDCPEYLALDGKDHCLDALVKKDKLNILSQEEKLALTEMRKANISFVQQAKGGLL